MLATISGFLFCLHERDLLQQQLLCLGSTSRQCDAACTTLKVNNLSLDILHANISDKILLGCTLRLVVADSSNLAAAADAARSTLSLLWR